jgi:hypothetical protein
MLAAVCKFSVNASFIWDQYMRGSRWSLLLTFRQGPSELRERHFGCEAVCGASHNAITFRATDAIAAFATLNADLLDLLAPQFEEQLRQLKAEDTFVQLEHLGGRRTVPLP